MCVIALREERRRLPPEVKSNVPFVPRVAESKQKLWNGDNVQSQSGGEKVASSVVQQGAGEQRMVHSMSNSAAYRGSTCE